MTYPFEDTPVCKLLRKHLKETGLMQREVSAAIGLPAPNVLSMIVSGKLVLPIGRAADLARVLEIPLPLLCAMAEASYQERGGWPAAMSLHRSLTAITSDTKHS